MNRLRQAPWMVLAWVAMGAIVTAGLVVERLDAIARCETANELRRQDLPAAFDEFGRFLGQELDADPEEVMDARRRFAMELDELLPEKKCPTLW